MTEHDYPHFLRGGSCVCRCEECVSAGDQCTCPDCAHQHDDGGWHVY